MFRKDAIYRRMKHYARESGRSQVKIAELERRWNTTEAALAALEATWAQVRWSASVCSGVYVLFHLKVLGTIRSLAKPEDLPDVDVDTHGARHCLFSNSAV